MILVSWKAILEDMQGVVMRSVAFGASVLRGWADLNSISDNNIIKAPPYNTQMSLTGTTVVVEASTLHARRFCAHQCLVTDVSTLPAFLLIVLAFAPLMIFPTAYTRVPRVRMSPASLTVRGLPVAWLVDLTLLLLDFVGELL